MQIDFHHAVTYVAARLAGFSRTKADIIANSCQYVDDATSSGTVFFDNKALYCRISSAHKMIDLRNTREVANHQVWIPFHFLPGNGGLQAGHNPEGRFIEKIVCTPKSHVAREMVRQTIVDRDRPYGLHRLGITMHIFADTWAHQGFAGVIHPVNEVEDAEETGGTRVFDSGLGGFLRDVLDDAIPPLGHGRANIFPDMPFLSWQYKNFKGNLISRNNTDLFCEAANELCMAMQRYRAGDLDARVAGINGNVMNKIQDLFMNTTEKDGEKRHAVWLKAIANNVFGFGAETISYPGKGKGSWKEAALGTSFDLPVHTYSKKFLKSNWKFFHDALQAHRLYIIHDLLPHYDICAA